MSETRSPRSPGSPGSPRSPRSPRGLGKPSLAARRQILEHPRVKGARRAASPRSPPTTPRTIKEKFKIGPVLGRGSFSVVRLAEDRASGASVALKVIKKPRFKAGRGGGAAEHERREAAEDQLVQLAKEVKLTQLAQHPSVVQILDVVETRQRVYIVMEHVAGGDLFDYVCGRGALPTAEALRIFRQVVDAVDHFHHRNVCHRDLKPENILMSACGSEVKVADFGLARLTDGEAGQCETRCGSPHYMAPEQFAFAAYDGKQADVWALGALLYVMCTASMPFSQAQGEETLPSLARAIHAGRYHTPSFVDRDVADLIARCLTVRPDRRITVAGILEHPAWRHLDRRRRRAAEGEAEGGAAARDGAGPEGSRSRIRRDSLQVLQPVRSADGDDVVAESVAEPRDDGSADGFDATPREGNSPASSGDLASY